MKKIESVKLHQYNNDWYKPGANKLKIILWVLCSSVIFRNTLPIPSSLKVFVLRIFGASVGTKVVIKSNVNIKYPWNLTIGSHSWVGENVWIDCLVEVVIEDNCCLSQGCYLLTGNHDYKSESFDLIVNSIRIENSAWVGAYSVVCPGVTVGHSSVLTVGSVATRDLEKNYVYQGNPAAKIKKRFE